MDGPISGYDDEDAFTRDIFGVFVKFDAVHIGHFQVRDDEVEIIPFDAFERIEAACGIDDIEPFGFEDCPYRLADAYLVVND
jgi:hypothetical protein